MKSTVNRTATNQQRSQSVNAMKSEEVRSQKRIQRIPEKREIVRNSKAETVNNQDQSEESLTAEGVVNGVQFIEQNQRQNPQTVVPQRSDSNLLSNHDIVEPQRIQRLPKQRPFVLRATAPEWNGYGYPQNNGVVISTPIHKPNPMINRSPLYSLQSESIWAVDVTNMETKPYWNENNIINIAEEAVRSVVNDGMSISSRSAFSSETPNEDRF